MEGRGNEKKPIENNIKDRHQGKPRSGASVQSVPNNEEELASQLAKIERDLRRKERKLEKYSKVLKAKEHVRDTLRKHNEGQATSGTATPSLESPPRAFKPWSSRVVTFSTKSPEVQYVAKTCTTPPHQGKATTTPPPQQQPPSSPHTNLPQGCDRDEKKDQILPVELYTESLEPKDLSVRKVEGEECSGPNSTGGLKDDKDSSTIDTITPSDLLNDLTLCVPAVTEVTGHLSAPPHASTSLQANTITSQPPPPSINSPLPLLIHAPPTCMDAEQCHSPKTLPYKPASLKQWGDEAVISPSSLPPTAAPASITTTPKRNIGLVLLTEQTPQKDLTLPAEQMPHLLASQFSPQSDVLKRKYIYNQHHRWKDKDSPSGSESSGSSCSSSSRKEKAGKLMKEYITESVEDVRGIIEEVDKRETGKESMFEKGGEGSHVRVRCSNLSYLKETEMNNTKEDMKNTRKEDMKNNTKEDMNNTKKGDIEMKESGKAIQVNVNENFEVQVKKIDAFRFTSPYSKENKSLTRPTVKRKRRWSTIPLQTNTNKPTNTTKINTNSNITHKTQTTQPNNTSLNKQKTENKANTQNKTNKTDIDEHSQNQISSSNPSVKLVEGPEGSVVEAWSLPAKDRCGVLLTTAITTVGSSCVLLVVQECGLEVWGLSSEGEGWRLAGETQHSIRDVVKIRDIKVEGLACGVEEARYLMVVVREAVEEVELMYIQLCLARKNWQLSSTLIIPPFSASSLTLCTLGEWSATLCWSPRQPSNKTTLTVLDFDVTYSRRGRKWELVCCPCSRPLPGGVGGASADPCITSLHAKSGWSGVVVCWSADTLTLYDPWRTTVLTSFPSPITTVLWAAAVEELLFVLGQRSGQSDITLAAINPLTGLCDPFLTFTLNKGNASVPPAALRESGSPWRLTGVSLLPDRLTLSFSAGHGAYVYFNGMTVPT